MILRWLNGKSTLKSPLNDQVNIHLDVNLFDS